MKKQIVVILGMHRSGTSVIAQITQSLGYNLGNRLLEPNDENPKGFFENQEIVSFNDRLLRQIGLSWDSLGYIWEEKFDEDLYEDFFSEANDILSENFTKSSFWAIKDPRLCILLPFWQRAIHRFQNSDISYLLCLRNPLESYLSQKKRNEIDPSFHIIGEDRDTFLLMWYTYLRRAIASIDSDSCLCVSYENVLSEPVGELNRVAKFLDVCPNDNVRESFKKNFIEKELRHHNATNKELIDATQHIPFISKLYSKLKLKDNEKSISRNELIKIKAEITTFDELSSLYLFHVQKLYGKLYCQHLLSRRDNLEADKHIKMMNTQNKLLEEKLTDTNKNYEIAQKALKKLEAGIQKLKQDNIKLSEQYQTVIKSRRWRLISLVLKVFGR